MKNGHSLRMTPELVKARDDKLSGWHVGSTETRIAKRPSKPRTSKYGAVRTIVDGIRFASKKEAARYRDLRLMQQGGLISELRWQVPFEIRIKEIYICSWLADFTYTAKDGMKCTEDVKGMRTDVYKLKKKLVEAQYNIRILET